MSEKELPFDTEQDPLHKDRIEPGFYDQILVKENMYKEVTPYHIKTSIHNCFACEMRKHHKPLELSNFDAPVMVIGETPTDVDFKTKEGKLLADTLSWSKYNLDDIYFTSLVKCEENGVPEKCMHHLLSEILSVQPQIMIVLGYDVSKYLDHTVTQPGYITSLFGRFDMLATYRTTYIMSSQDLFQQYCGHFLQAKQALDSKLQRSP